MMTQRGAESVSLACKVFTFEDDEEKVSVSIPEVLDPRYGMYVWPCAVVLAQYVWTQRGAVRGRTVLELGAGVALPGALAARCGAQVILTDDGAAPRCLENCRRSCEANGLLDVDVLGLTWGDVSPDLVHLPPLDLILGSDVFYEPRDFEDVLLTVSVLLRRNPGAQFWTTYQERSADWSVEVLLLRWGLQCVVVPLETFNADKSELCCSSLPGNHSVLMLLITLTQ